MKRQLSEEQIDQLMRTLANVAAADEETINEIADSPATWWGVQRQINEQKATTLSAWPPIAKVLRWLMIGAPAVAAVLILSFFVFRPAGTGNSITKSVIPPVTPIAEITPSTEQITMSQSTNAEIDQPPTKIEKPRPVVAKFSHEIKRAIVKPVTTTTSKTRSAKSAEIKTEFIALSYARDPESGQIVRVKVPSSMLVSLGVVANVKQPSDLVDAEVLVGDDGLTRAIRFIR
ncbi:MAG: hypothetical protein ACKVRN_13825 [Pyrinomonadaceae bacterium]